MINIAGGILLAFAVIAVLMRPDVLWGLIKLLFFVAVVSVTILLLFAQANAQIL